VWYNDGVGRMLIAISISYARKLSDLVGRKRGESGSKIKKACVKERFVNEKDI
jgi:hypothetical protein